MSLLLFPSTVYASFLSYGVRDRCNDESTDQPKHPKRSLSRAISRDAFVRNTQDKSSRDKFPRQAPAGTGSGMPRGNKRSSR